MKYQIKEGETFYCTKDMITADDKVQFKEDKEYTCEKNGCLTNEQGQEVPFEREDWAFDFMDLFEAHFINVKEM